MRVFPNAKVILTVRDDPEAWYTSVRESVLKFHDVTREFPASLAVSLLVGNLTDDVRQVSFIDIKQYKR